MYQIMVLANTNTTSGIDTAVHEFRATGRPTSLYHWWSGRTDASAKKIYFEKSLS